MEDFNSIKKYLSISNIDKAVQNIKKYKVPIFLKEDTPISFSNKIIDILTQEFGFYLSPLIKIKSNSFKPPLYRVRRYEDFNSSIFSEYSYKPAGIVNDIGRCNFPKTTVFYSSNNPKVSILETIKDRKETEGLYFLSRWEFVDTMQDIFVQSLLYSNKIQNEYYKKQHDDFFNELMVSKDDELNTEEKKAINMYQEFINTIFIEDKYYAISASIAYSNLFAPHKYRPDIIIYPSVQSELRGLNFCLHPNFVNANLKISRIYLLKVKKDINNRLDLNFIKIGLVDRNLINWNDIPKDGGTYKNVIDDDFNN